MSENPSSIWAWVVSNPSAACSSEASKAASATSRNAAMSSVARSCSSATTSRSCLASSWTAFWVSLACASTSSRMTRNVLASSS